MAPSLLPSLLQGIVIGFSVAAPVGPIGLLCIQRTLANGRASGLISGLGAATADAAYGSVAGFGLAFISEFLTSQQLWIRLLGGAFLLFLGARIFLSIPKSPVNEPRKRKMTDDYLSTLALTLSNPVTIVSFAAIFAGLGITGRGGDYATATALVSGVFTGSVLWWVLLSTGVGAIKGSLDSNRMRWINRFSGVVISSFGAIASASLLL